MSKSEEWIIPDELDLDDALGQAIGEAMGPERADESGFARGIQERIEAGTRGRTGFARTAAALLPPLLLPKSLAKGGAVLGGATLEKAGWKLLPGIVAMPVVVAVLLILTFAAGLRRIVVPTEQTLERKRARNEVAAWWRKYFVPVGLMMLALIWLGSKAPIEAVMLFVMLSMVSLVGIYGVLARAGLATRREVGYRASSFLFGLVVWGQLLSGLIESHSPGQVWPLGLPISLTLGGLVCTILGFQDGPKDRRENWRAWLVGIVGVGFVGMYLFLGGLGRHPVTRSQAVEFVEGSFQQTGGVRDEVQELCSTVIHLSRDGGSAPDLDAFRRALWSWIDENPEGAAKVNSLYLIEPEGLGLLRPKDYVALRNDYRLEHLVAEDSPMGGPEHEILQVVIRDRERPFSEEERDILVARVLAGVEPVGSHACLEDLYVRWQLLQRINRTEAGQGMAEGVRENLLAMWAVRLDGVEACFAPGRSSLQPSERIPEPLDTLTFVWLDSTDYGLRLMADFGVPEGIDLTQLDGYLDDMARSYGYKSVPGYRAKAASMRQHLHALPEWGQLPSRPKLHLWMGYRLLLAGASLALFCVLVTLRIPKSLNGADSVSDAAPSDGIAGGSGKHS